MVSNQFVALVRLPGKDRRSASSPADREVYTWRVKHGGLMPSPRVLAVTAIILCSAFAAGKDKKKAILPVDVLKARTVLVVVDPSAGVDVTDPNANRNARSDVQKALDQWA